MISSTRVPYSRLFFVAAAVAACGFAMLSAAAEPLPWKAHGRLGVSANGRFLQHRDGTPFLWLGDTAWALFYKLNREEVRAYLDDRK